ncbi:MAG: rhamnulokinase [Lachnospiraceae bacterium]|nr:rhamnulokinase [Lachnospiraceae bacterium]
MKKEKRVLAFDYGASSGRAIIGTFDGNTISLEEIHRFANEPVTVNGTMYWDILRLFHELKQGLLKAKHKGSIDSIGVDTWGVDFGLLDKKGNLLANPVHYRDTRTEGMLEKSFQAIDKDTFYQITGNQFMEINTVFQLLSIIQSQPELLLRVDKLLMMPDLINYFLTGKKKAECSIASTTQLMDIKKGNWSAKVMQSLQIPQHIFPEIIPSGTKLGTVTDKIQEELEIGEIEVIAVAGHDTQSALVSVPTEEKEFIFISCGTWSLFGTELEKPIINKQSAELNITNEIGYGGRVSFLKNIIGLWLIQESRRQWSREGKEYTFGELETMAKGEEAFRCFIDPDAPEFVPAGNIPRRIRAYCERTGQWIPQNEGQIVRCINESLAFKYRETCAEIQACTQKDYETIYMVGGGTQSKLLCQMTANACHKKVSAGPIEATVYGNIALQLMACGDISNIDKAREIIKASADVDEYVSQNEIMWEDAYQRYKEITRV